MRLIEEIQPRARFRPIIRAVIRRRIAAGVDLSVREIRKEAGGGSNNTILDEIRLAMSTLTADALPEARERSTVEQVKHLYSKLIATERTNEILRTKISTLERTIEGLQTVIESASGPKGILLDRLMHLEERIKERDERSLEELRGLVQGAKGLIQQIPTEGIQRVVEKDPLLEGRHQVLLREHAALIKRHDALRSAYFQETGNDPDDLLRT